MKLSLTATPKKSILDNKILNEKVDMNILRKLLNSTLLKTSFRNPFTGEMYASEKEQLEKYAKLVKNGFAKVRLTRKFENYGRCNPVKSLSLFSIRREIRQTLAYDYYVDIDIENCHPQILYQVMKHNKIETPYLEQYINSRDTILEETKKRYGLTLRDTVKNLYIRTMYNSTVKSWKKDNNIDEKLDYEFAVNYEKELKGLMKIILKNNPELEKIITEDKKKNNKSVDNILGSVSSYYLQTIEEQILEEMYKYCVENKYIINDDGVTCADGLMLPRKNYKEELLQNLQILIYSKFGLLLTFTQKEMKEHYLKILDESQKEEKEENDYLIKKKEFEKKNFKLRNPVVYCEEADGELIIRNRQELINLYENCYFKTFTFTDKKMTESKEQFIKQWLIDENIRTYSKITFNPDLSKETGVYNMFRGFKYDNDDKPNTKLIEPFLDLIKYITGSDYETFLDWMAWIRQKPYQKTGVSVILYSDAHGVGKNTILLLLNKVFEDYTTKINNIDDLMANFNKLLANRLVIYGDEIKARSDDLYQTLKNQIKETERRIEAKNKDAIILNDYSNMIFTTNCELSVKIEEQDRRMFLIECPTKKLEDSFFDKVYKLLNNVDAIKSFDSLLKTRILPNKIVPPLNDYKKRVMSSSIPAFIQMIYKDYQSYAGNKITISDIIRDSKIYAKNNNLKYTFTDRYISIHFKEEFKEFFTKSRECNYYKFPSDKELLKVLMTKKHNYLLTEYNDIEVEPEPKSEPKLEPKQKKEKPIINIDSDSDNEEEIINMISLLQKKLQRIQNKKNAVDIEEKKDVYDDDMMSTDFNLEF